ncbi:MAG: hypothetical protein MJZ63_07485 [Muribaculaceae bacterium]|nr:hypothetical protein [Muribaculaceae bacterium]
MKKVVLALTFLMPLSMIQASYNNKDLSANGDNAQAQELTEAALAEQQSAYTLVAAKNAETEDLAKKQATEKELTDLVNRFYTAFFKAERAELSLLSHDFNSVVRKATATYNDMFGGSTSPGQYFLWYFDISSAFGTEDETDQVKWDVDNIQIRTEESAVVYLKLKGHYVGNSTNKWESFSEKVMCVKTSDGWVIDDVVRDARSIKQAWRTNPPCAA